MKKLFIILCIAGAFLPGCKKYLDVNHDPNNPIDVKESLLLAPIELNISDNLQAGNVGTNIQNYLQVIAPNQPNPGIWNYQSFNGDFDGDWTNFYVVSLNNLRILNTKAETNLHWDYAAIAKILSAYSLGTATDLWGDIPYSKAFNITNFLVPYDKQEDIYKTVQSLLNDAIADMSQTYTPTVGSDDYFYNGNMAQWLKVAWSLKARYAMHLTKAPGYTAVAQADSALIDIQHGMTSNADDLAFPYVGSPGSEDPLYLLFTPVTTYVLNSTLVDTLIKRNDPRLPVIVLPAVNSGVDSGRTIGTAPSGSLDDYSYPNTFYGAPSSPNYIFSYSELAFIRAEALLITSGVAAAKPVYVNAVNSHFSKLGLDTTSAAVTTYLTTRTLTAGNALEFIIEEKAIANLYNIENFTDWRRTGFPILHKVIGALSEIPRRQLYPESEIITNPQPQQTAVLTDRVWWDAP
jgi:hypothetical protein